MNANDKSSWLWVVWEALHDWQEAHEGRAAVGTETYDERWDDICTAMAWIHEELGVSQDEGIDLNLVANPSSNQIQPQS